MNVVFRSKPCTRLVGGLILLLMLAGCRGSNVGLDVGAGSLHRAAAEGKLNEVERLIDAGTPVDIRAKGSRATPLHFAARDGRYAVARLLVASGVEVNTIVPFSGETPLMDAVSKGRIELTRIGFYPDSTDYRADVTLTCVLLNQSGMIEHVMMGPLLDATFADLEPRISSLIEN